MQTLNYSPTRAVTFPASRIVMPAVVAGARPSTDWGRLGVEILFYAAIGSRVFGHQLGILRFTGLSGAMILSSALVCLVIMLSRHEKIPASIVFALLINVIAVITDLVWLGLLNRDMIFWLCTLLMACFIVQNESALNRVLLFIAACVAGALALDAVFAAERVGIQRLYLNKDGAGNMFANSNDLAQIACVTAVILLFRGISRPLLTKCLLYAVALGLAGVTLLTLSRQGLLILCAGFLLYCFALLLKRKGSFELIFIAAAIVFFLLYYRENLVEILNGYAYRFNQDSGRTGYWATALRDMQGSFLAGFGSENGYSFDGSLPHSTFLWLHLAFGGACAWIYALWIGSLGWRTARFVLGNDYSWPLRVETLTIFLMFLAAQFTTVFAPGNYAFILCVAILETRFAMLDQPDAEGVHDMGRSR